MIRRQKIWKARNWDGMDGIGGANRILFILLHDIPLFMDGRRISSCFWFGNIMM